MTAKSVHAISGESCMHAYNHPYKFSHLVKVWKKSSIKYVHMLFVVCFSLFHSNHFFFWIGSWNSLFSYLEIAFSAWVIFKIHLRWLRYNSCINWFDALIQMRVFCRSEKLFENLTPEFWEKTSFAIQENSLSKLKFFVQRCKIYLAMQLMRKKSIILSEAQWVWQFV